MQTDMKNRIDMKKMILAVLAAVAVAGSAGAQSGVKYPYVTTASDGGVIVVLRDDKGGIDEASLFSSRVTASKTGNEASTDNRMSRKFRVQKAQSKSSTVNWSDAISYCDNLTEEGYSDWRLPSQRELGLIWLMGGNNKSILCDDNDTGVGESSYPVNTPWIYEQSGMTPLASDKYYWTSNLLSEDEEKAWTIRFDYGMPTMIRKALSAWLRCVRDEW